MRQPERRPFGRLTSFFNPKYDELPQGSDWVGAAEDLQAAVNDNEKRLLWRASAVARLRGITLSPAEGMRGMAPLLMEPVLDAVGRVRGNDEAALIADMQVVTVNSDDVFLQTNFARGAVTVTLSSAFVSCINMFESVAQVCKRESPAPNFGASIAAVRYLVLQQSYFRLNSIHTLKRARPRLSPIALMFGMAHEAAHVALAHPQGDAHTPGAELEADAYAWQVLSTDVSHIGSGLEPLAKSAVLCVLVADFAGRAGFIRASSSHPPLNERLDALAALGVELAAAVAEFRPIAKLIDFGIDLETPLLDSVWDDLRTSKVWKIRTERTQSYELSKHLDKLTIAPHLTLREIATHSLRPGHLTALEPLLREIAIPDSILIQELIDGGIPVELAWIDGRSPVALADVVDAFADADEWPAGSTRAETVVAAAAGAQLLARMIKRSDQGAS